jgi:D-ribulokinase
MKNPLVLGIDVGTEGVRVVIADTTGRVMEDVYQEFSQAAIPALPPGYLEQNPQDWWDAVVLCLRQALSGLHKHGYTSDEIVAGAVDSKSGIIVLLDEEKQPLRPALLHDDCRAQAEAQDVNEESAALQKKLGYRFDASFSLPKILWLLRHEPENWKKTRCIAHAADYIVGKLTNVFCATDQNNALKTGFDLVDFSWPAFIDSNLGIEEHRLPWVMRSGETVYHVSKQCADETGLAQTTRIVAGTTSPRANQIASGARRIGDWNTQLGTPIVVRGLTKDLLIDPLGRFYCHLHPQGFWMPSGTSSVSAHVLDERFPNLNKGNFSQSALFLAPTSLLVYPLAGKDEGFVNNYPKVESFVEGQVQSEQELYVAHLEGLAYIERLIYGVLSSLGAEIRERIYTTGNGAENLEWMQIRADVLGMECARVENANAAMGSAIVAASRTLFTSIEEASAKMVRLDRVISPRPPMVLHYADSYPAFLDACRRHGLVNNLGRLPQ